MSNHSSRTKLAAFLGKLITVDADISYERIGMKPLKSGYYLPEGADGQRIRVFVIGFRNPPTHVSGRVVALIHENGHHTGQPTALILAPDGMRMHQAEIAKHLFLSPESARHFTIEPLYHKSCGAIIYRKTPAGDVEFLLLHQQGSDTWSFPKGHMELGESERQTAKREVSEEAGFVPTFHPGFREEIRYRISVAGEKTVVLFLAEYDGRVLVRQSEISDYRWVTSSEVWRLCRRQNLIRAMEKAKNTVLSST